MDPHLRRAPFGVLTVARDGTVTGINDAAADLLETAPDAAVGDDVATAMPASVGRDPAAAFADPPPSRTTFEEFYPAVDRWLAVDVVPDDGRAVVYLRDRTDARERENDLDRLRRRLDLIEEIDALTARTVRTVIDADDSDAVARTVCEGLGTADRYEFAWVVETDPTGEGLRAAASAGDAADLADALRGHLDRPPAGSDADPAPALLEWRALRSGTTALTDALAADDRLPEDVRTAAFGRGLQSAVAVPLAHGETTFGVLGVYLSREHGLGESERSGLETLGAVAGHAITAGRREDLLFADTVTELVVRVDDADLPLPTAARAGDATLSIVGVVPRSGGTDGTDGTGGAPDAAASPVEGAPAPGEGTVVCYLRADADVALDPAVAALDDHDRAADPRVVDEDGRPLLETTLVGTPPTALAARGASVGAGTVDADGYRLVAAASADVPTRTLLEAVDAVAAETALRSKTEEPRTSRTAAEFRSDLEEALTERQRTVLRTAYLSEYFASPRGSSAEEVAEALDVTGPTVLYHLRRAQRKLLDAFFADDDGPT